MKKYVAYYRVSTKKQKKSGLGLEAQQAIVEHFADADGATIVHTFTEAESGDVSATFENFVVNPQALDDNQFLVNQIPPNVTPNFGWFNPDFSESFTCNEITECSDNQLAAPNIEIDDYYWGIAIDEIDISQLDEVYRWLIKRNIYKAIKEKYDPTEVPLVLIPFLAEEVGTTIHEFYDIDKKIQQLSKLEPDLRLEIKGLFDNIRLAYEADMPNQQAFLQMEVSEQLAYLQAPETINFNTNIANWSHQKDILQEQLKDAIIQEVNDLLDQNAAIQIDSEKTYEQAEQRINEIYLSTIINNSFSLTKTEQDEIIDIADMCPLEGGSAVYKARTLFSLFGGRPKVEWLESCGGYASERNENNELKQQKINISSVYPNPNTGTFEVLLPVFEKATWNLTNTFGKVIQSGQFTQPNEEITTNNISGGLYLLEIRDEHGIIAVHKVLIL